MMCGTEKKLEVLEDQCAKNAAGNMTHTAQLETTVGLLTFNSNRNKTSTGETSEDKPNKTTSYHFLLQLASTSSLSVSLSTPAIGRQPLNYVRGQSSLDTFLSLVASVHFVIF